MRFLCHLYCWFLPDYASPLPLPLPHSLCLLVCVCVYVWLICGSRKWQFTAWKIFDSFSGSGQFVYGRQTIALTDRRTDRETYIWTACLQSIGIVRLQNWDWGTTQTAYCLSRWFEDSMNVTSQWMWPEMLIETGRGRYIAQYICITYNIIVILYVCECIN